MPFRQGDDRRRGGEGPERLGIAAGGSERGAKDAVEAARAPEPRPSLGPAAPSKGPSVSPALLGGASAVLRSLGISPGPWPSRHSRSLTARASTRAGPEWLVRQLNAPTRAADVRSPALDESSRAIEAKAKAEIRAGREALLEQPAETYRAILERRRTGGVNFAFPELAPFLALIDQQLESLLARRFSEALPGAGPSSSESRTVAALWRPEHATTARALRRDLARLAAKGHPYRDSWQLVGRHLSFLSSFHHPGEIEAIQAPDGGTITHTRLERWTGREDLVLWPVQRHFPLVFMPRVGFAPIYPVGISLRCINEFDGRPDQSALSFFLHDLAHADLMTGLRDQDLGLGTLWHSAQSTAGQRAEREALIQRRQRVAAAVLAAVDREAQGDPQFRALAYGLLTLMLHEHGWFAPYEIPKMIAVLERNIHDGVLDPTVQESIRNFTKVADPARIRDGAARLTRILKQLDHPEPSRSSG